MADASSDIDRLLADLDDPAFVRVTRISIPIAPQELVDRLDALDAELQAEIASGNGINSRVPLLDRQIKDLDTELQPYMREFVFKSLGHKAWADLLAKHPPTAAQVKANKRAEFNENTFPAAAIAATCTSPAMTVEQAEILQAHENVTDAQFRMLFSHAVAAQQGGLNRPKSGTASLYRRMSEAFEKPPTITEPLEASSSDES